MRHPDETTERVIDELRRRVDLLERGPLAGSSLLLDVELDNNNTRTVPHGLKGKYVAVFVSPPRGAVTTGRIDEIRDTVDLENVYLRASGFGATITVDVLVL